MKVVLKFLLAVLLAVVGGFLGAVVHDFTRAGPDTVTWRRLPDPPERPVRIIAMGGVGGDAQRVLIEAASGEQYECCNIWPAAWMQVKDSQIPSVAACPDFQDSPLDRLPGVAMDCAYVMQWEWVTEEHYVVLLDDGSLWRWRYFEGVTVLFRYITWGMLSGFCAGIFMLFRPWRKPAP
jgi:hypothetical protein